MRNPFKRKRKDMVYPLNTCRNTYRFVKKRLHLTDIEIVCEIVKKTGGKSGCRISGLMEIVKATRKAAETI
jgi:hypothetical protein